MGSSSMNFALYLLGLCLLAQTAFTTKDEEDELLDLLADDEDSGSREAPKKAPKWSGKWKGKGWKGKGEAEDDDEVITNVERVKKILPIKSLEEVLNITPIKSIEEVKKITPIESIQEVKSMKEVESMLEVPDEIAKRFIEKHRLRPGSMDDEPRESPEDKYGSDFGGEVCLASDEATEILECVSKIQRLLESSLGGSYSAPNTGGGIDGGVSDSDDSGETDLGDLGEVKSIEPVKRITPIKSIEEVKNIEEVKKITPLDSVKEVVAMYELTDEQARTLRRLNNEKADGKY